MSARTNRSSNIKLTINAGFFFIVFCYCLGFEDHTDSILFVPSGREITLKPIEVYRIPVSLSAKEEGLYRSHLQLIVEDGKIM